MRQAFRQWKMRERAFTPYRKRPLAWEHYSDKWVATVQDTTEMVSKTHEYQENWLWSPGTISGNKVFLSMSFNTAALALSMAAWSTKRTGGIGVRATIGVGGAALSLFRMGPTASSSMICALRLASLAARWLGMWGAGVAGGRSFPPPCVWWYLAGGSGLGGSRAGGGGVRGGGRGGGGTALGIWAGCRWLLLLLR